MVPTTKATETPRMAISVLVARRLPAMTPPSVTVLARHQAAGRTMLKKNGRASVGGR